MSKPAHRASIGAIIKILCDRFPQTFSVHDPRPLKVGVHSEIMAALGDAVPPRNLRGALRAYTGTARYLRGLTAGACRVGLDGKPADTVTPADEAVAKKRLVDSVKEKAPQAKLAPAGKAAPEEPAERSAADNRKSPAPPVPKRLSLADLREAGRRRRGAAA